MEWKSREWNPACNGMEPCTYVIRLRDTTRYSYTLLYRSTCNITCRHNCLPPDIEKEDLLTSDSHVERKIFGSSRSKESSDSD